MRPQEAPAALTRALVLGIDAILYALLRVEEFSTRQDCILRIALRRSDREFHLPGDVDIRPGEVFGELHLWNEHLPHLRDYPSELAWAAHLTRLMASSLGEFAHYVENDPRFEKIQAFRGETAIGLKRSRQLAERPILRLGFIRLPEQKPGLGRRFALFWENLYSMALIWTFHPDIIRGKRLWQMERLQIWMTRKTLMARYGPDAQRHQGGAF